MYQQHECSVKVLRIMESLNYSSLKTPISICWKLWNKLVSRLWVKNILILLNAQTSSDPQMIKLCSSRSCSWKYCKRLGNSDFENELYISAVLAFNVRLSSVWRVTFFAFLNVVVSRWYSGRDVAQWEAGKPCWLTVHRTQSSSDRRTGFHWKDEKNRRTKERV